jgi:hypothetical protein
MRRLISLLVPAYRNECFHTFIFLSQIIHILAIP